MSDASDIAKTLRDAGFDQSVPGTPTPVRHLDTRTEGFAVTQRGPVVRVRHTKGTAARKARMTGKYARVLRDAGWAVAGQGTELAVEPLVHWTPEEPDQPACDADLDAPEGTTMLGTLNPSQVTCTACQQTLGAWDMAPGQ